MMKWVLLTATLSWGMVACPASATPPDAYHGELKAICASPDRVIWLLDFSTNQGTHYADQTDLAWAVLDLHKGNWTFEPIAEVTTSTVNNIRPDDEPELVKVVDGKGKRLGALLKEIGVTSCPPRTRRFPRDVDLGVFSYAVKDGKLVAHLRGIERTVGPVPKWPNVVVLARTDEGGYDFRPAFRGINCLHEQEGPCRKSPRVEYLVGKHAVMVFSMPGEYEEGTTSDTVFVVAAERLAMTRSTILNVIGFRYHKRRDYKTARRWFAAAQRQHRHNDTANYNHACASGRIKNIRAALYSLGLIKDKKNMKRKIARDKDFDLIRQDPKFVRFVERLPD